MARSKRAGHEEEHGNDERWLLTYADMITLLMALFIVLYSMSVLNKSKFEAFQSSLKNNKATGQPDLARPAIQPVDKPQPPSPPSPPLADLNQLKQLQQEIQKSLDAAGLHDAALVAVDARGLIVDITAGVLFDTGKAELRPDGTKVITVIAPKIAQVPNPIIVEGHTDNQPIHSALFPTNWELSTARSTTVLRAFLDAWHVDASRMTAAGYADTRPIVANDTDFHRAENRRVVVIVQAPPEATPSAPSASDAPSPAGTGAPAGPAVRAAGAPASPRPVAPAAAPIPAATGAAPRPG